MSPLYELSGRPTETGFAGVERKVEENPDDGGDSLKTKKQSANVVLLPARAVFFQRNPDKLAAGSYACFLEQLLECRFH